MYTTSEIMQFVQENDVKFIRLAFCDESGVMKNISVMPDSLETVFTDGLSFDGELVFGGVVGKLTLFPQASTLMVLPWRPSQGRVIRFFCDIRKTDGSPFEKDYRFELVQLAEKHQYAFTAECSFYFLKVDDVGKPLSVPWDEGGYLDIAPTDKGENVRREICLSLNEMGIRGVLSYHGRGAGQNCIKFGAESPIALADNIAAFRSAAAAIVARNGLYASFSAQPLKGMPLNGIVIELIRQSRKDLFCIKSDENPYIGIKEILRKTQV